MTNTFPRQRLVILGAESLGREAAEIGWLQPGIEEIVFLDDNPALEGQTAGGVPVRGRFDDYTQWIDGRTCFFVAIGRRALRRKWIQLLEEKGGPCPPLVHPGACLASSARVERGVLINFGCHVGPFVRVGEGSLLWTGVTLSHDCQVGPYCFIGPGVFVGGYTRIGGGCMIGIRAALCSDIKLGENCAVRMGAVVTRDLEPGMFFRREGQVVPLRGGEPEDAFFREHSPQAREQHRRTFQGPEKGPEA